MPQSQRQMSPMGAPATSASRRTLYLCAAAKVILFLAVGLANVPWTRLLESAVCRRYYAAAVATDWSSSADWPAARPDAGTAAAAGGVLGSLVDLLTWLRHGEMAEAQCKGDGVQAEMAELMGPLASFASIPGLVLTMPYSMLAKHLDRRILLFVSVFSTILATTFTLVMAALPNTNLRFLWLMGLFDLVGGGVPVFLMLVRSIIAESVEASHLSSVFFIITGLISAAQLGGAMFGSWLQQYGAAAAMLFAIAVLTSALPVLCFLPRSAAHPPDATRTDLRPPELPQAEAEDISAALRSDHTSPDLSLSDPRYSDGPAIDAIPDFNTTSPAEESTSDSTSWRKDGLRATIRRVSGVPFDDPVCVLFLTATFVNGLATAAQLLVKPWASKRYDWPLATVGYILGIESFLGVCVLFGLPWLSRTCVRRRGSADAASSAGEAAPPDEHARLLGRHAKPPDGHEDPTDDDAHLAERTGRVRRRWDFRVAWGSLALGAVGALVVALAGGRAAFVLGLVVATGAVGFPDALRALCTAGVAVADIQGLYAAGSAVETLSLIVASPLWGWLFALAYRGGSTWLGLPFGVCGVLLLCALVLVLRLKP